jgi:hypothetical protein
MDDEIQRFIDENDIRRVLTLYCRGIDRRDVELTRSVYWPDGTDDHIFFVGNAMDFVDMIHPMLAEYTIATQHSISNLLINVDGDVATTECHIHGYHVMRDRGLADVYIGGRYLDRLERRDGEWRIAERKTLFDWEQNAGLMMEAGQLADTMALDRGYPNDPSYRLFSRKTFE